MVYLLFSQCRLKSAGAVLVAKLVTGSLAYDDIWFGGRTRNPWNIEEYTTGSSAGPAACTSAGIFYFSFLKFIYSKCFKVLYYLLHFWYHHLSYLQHIL